MRYWLQRLGAAVALLLAVSALTFGAMNLLGDPLFNILGPTAASTTPEDLEILEAAKAEYNLDKSLPERYTIWAAGFVTGDFGVQFSEDGEPPVSNLIKERLPRTFTLLVMAQLFAAIIAIPWAAALGVQGQLVLRQIVDHCLLRHARHALASRWASILKYLLSIKSHIFPLTYTPATRGSHSSGS